MLIPSEEVFPHLIIESSGIWFVPTLGADTHAILLKLPSNVLKSIIKGCKVSLGFSLNNTASGTVLMTVVYVYDDQSTPVIVIGPEIVREQQIALVEILRDRQNTPIFFYDELARNVAEARCLFTDQTEEIIKLIGDVNRLYVGEANRDVKSALDQLEIDAETVISENTLRTEHVSVLEVALRNFIEFNLHIVGNREKSQFKITHPNEGDTLEQSVWHLLMGLFQNDLYRSPQVMEGRTKRELTDVLAISEYGIFIFESKSLSILNNAKEQSTARRAKNIEAHIKKALNQLIGATKSIHNGLEIYASDGRRIDFNRNIPPHGIVLISEMFHVVDWDTMFLEFAQATIKSKVFLHILDLRELARLVRGSKTANIFDHNLLERSKQVIEHRNLLVRVNFIKDKSEIEN
jgi:hypothetical protein